MNSQALLEFASHLAKQAGDIMIKEQESLTLDYKESVELVTQADVKVDQFLHKRILETYPDHQIISEETTPKWKLTHEPVWIIDPIDGTVNYAHKHNQSAVSIAFYQDAQALLAVVYNPFNNEMFSAIKGKGAWLNQKPIECSTKDGLTRALIATGFPYHKSNTQELAQRLATVLNNCADIRRLGSAALDICWVACGRMDAYYETVSLWDCAAARLIAKESGAQVGSFDPHNTQEIDWQTQHLLISNAKLYPQLNTLLGTTLTSTATG